MTNSLLNNLLKEYEQKRIDSVKDLELRKKTLYSKNPRLEEIENELTSISIKTAKSILSGNSKSYITDLKNNICKLNQERKTILNNLDISEDYLFPKYECNICKDTGYILENSSTKMCNCLKQKIFNIEYNKNCINNAKNENFNNFKINLYSDESDEKKYGLGISPRTNILDIKKASEEFIKNFNNPMQKNLIFSGGTGLGKTFLANCIVNELLKQEKTVLYQTAPVMLDTLINNMFSKNFENNIAENLLTVDLLVIDDLGTETMNSMKFTELYKIINTRLLNQENKITKTIISTNLDLKNLFKTYDERLVSRFVGYYDVYRFYGEDIRLKKY